jgi:membrane associated rhomboid family serine protease
MFPLRDSVPGKTTPFVTVGLIVANFLVWFWEESSPGVDTHVARDGFYPCSLHGPCVGGVHPLGWWLAVFTGMFMHAGWAHILGNMLFLWIFGNNVEDALGHFGFLFWYLAAGVVAMAVQTAVTLQFADVQAASIPNIGASGAIAGVLGAYFVLLPRARVLTLFFFGIILIREIPAVWFLGVWFLLQALTGGLSLLHPQSGGGVAFFAHIGGFAFGVASGSLLLARRNPHRYHLR